MIACVGVEAVVPTRVAADPCVAVTAEAGARLAQTWPDPGVAATVVLPRTRLELGASRGRVGARVGFGATRSGGEEGYIGIDGEAIVPVVRVAEARVQGWGFALAAGAIDLAWSSAADARWGLAGLGPSLGERTGWMDSADLGGGLGWVSPRGWVHARVELTAGEGITGREVNEGKNLGGFVEVRPLAGADHPERLRIALHARDGSRGLTSVRDDRAGVSVSLHTDTVDAGVEGLAAWGVDGDATRTPSGAALYANVRPWGPILAAARLDAWSEALSRADAGVLVLVGGLGVALREEQIGEARLLVGAEHQRVGAGVAAVAGADALQSSTSVFLQLETSLAWSPRNP